MPDVPDTTRIKAATLAAFVAVMCAACGSTTTVSAGPIAPVSVDCGLQAPGPNSVNGGFAEIDGFTVSEICPADVDPTFATQEFDSLAAGLVSQNGNPILRVLAGQLKSGSSHDFILTYLGKLADQTAPRSRRSQRNRRTRWACSEALQHSASHRRVPLCRRADRRRRLRRGGRTPSDRRRRTHQILDNLG